MRLKQVASLSFLFPESAPHSIPPVDASKPQDQTAALYNPFAQVRECRGETNGAGTVNVDSLY
jgi:hypothetical protein